MTVLESTTRERVRFSLSNVNGVVEIWTAAGRAVLPPGANMSILVYSPDVVVRSRITKKVPVE